MQIVEARLGVGPLFTSPLTKVNTSVENLSHASQSPRRWMDGQTSPGFHIHIPMPILRMTLHDDEGMGATTGLGRSHARPGLHPRSTVLADAGHRGSISRSFCATDETVEWRKTSNRSAARTG